MKQPEFLDAESIKELHFESLSEWGGQDGLRDETAFESAVFQPQNVYFYGHGDLFDIAAAYCFYIAEAQAFLDSNKRTAVASGLAFLELNGVDTDRDIEMSLYNAMIAVGCREMGKYELAALLRQLFGPMDV